MAGSLKKAALWSLAGVLALPLVAYATLFVVNLEDRPPAPETAVLRSLQEGGSPVRSSGNSYLFMLGFAGPPDKDPMSLGMERIEWMESARPEFDRSNDPLEYDYDFRALRSVAVAETAETCARSETDCFRLLESDDETAEPWLAEERWLLDRYRALLAMEEFREARPFEVLAPLPSYNVVFEGQRLHIVDAWKSATEEDAAAVNAALERDLVFWRMVLRNSDVLITKMIATAAIIRHFKFGNMVLRRLPQEVAFNGIPTSWRVQITDEERSMMRTLAGEWAFFDQSIKNIDADLENPFAGSMDPTDLTAWDRLTWVLVRPFWQPQDLSNRHAGLMLDLVDAFNVSYDETPRAVHVADELQDSAFRPFSGICNFTGDIAMGLNHWSFSSYAVRVSDLEGIRRLALAVAELRAAGTREASLGERISASEIVDPYTNAPFTWLPDEGVLVFHGLEPYKPRSEHKLAF